MYIVGIGVIVLIEYLEYDRIPLLKITLLDVIINDHKFLRQLQTKKDTNFNISLYPNTTNAIIQ